MDSERATALSNNKIYVLYVGLKVITLITQQHPGCE